jgi:hypothetical protein
MRFEDDPFQPHLARCFVHGLSVASVVIDIDDALPVNSPQLLDDPLDRALRVGSG